MVTDPNDLQAYPRPSIAVDVVLLTVLDGNLAVVLRRRDMGSDIGLRMLPGTMLRERERLANAALRCLETRMQIKGRAPRQLHVFDDPYRDKRGWVLTITHLDVLPMEELSRALKYDLCELWPVDQHHNLPFGHDRIIAMALEVVRSEYDQKPDPWNLLDDVFTMAQLREVHESVAGKSLQKDTFRRFMKPHLYALETRTTPPGGNGLGRPAQLYVKRH